MISKLNSITWSVIDEALTPLPSNSKQWSSLHWLSAGVLLPIGLVTVVCDTALRVFSGMLSIVWKNPQDPKNDFEVVCNDSRKWEQLDPDNVVFDKDFLFGMATCTFQDSGAVNCPDSQWATWEEKKVAKDNRSGRSANLFELYKTPERRNEIISRLKKLGCNSYRFNIEWSHIEPKQEEYNMDALDVYVNFCKALKLNGIKPMVTLHHFSEPKWFHDLGSFEKEENIAYFINFCKKVYPVLTQNYWFKPLVEHICTINEPGVEAFSRYVRGAFSPGYYFQFEKAGHFLKGMLKAHCIAYTALKELNPNVQIGIVHQRLKMETVNPLLRPIVHVINRLVNETTLNFFKTGIFSYKIPLASHLREEGLVPKTDFVGLQYYTRPVIGMFGPSSYFESMTQMPFREDPEGLYKAIEEVYNAFKKPIIITENGISTHRHDQRGRYLSRALYATKKASEKIGLKNLRGYFYWSFCDNSEWDMGRHPQAFGAYALNEDGTLAPEPKEGMKKFITIAKKSRDLD